MQQKFIPTMASKGLEGAVLSQSLLWIGFILASLNLRLIFATVGPLLKNLELGFMPTLLITTLPVALLGIFSIPGVYLRRRMGEERALFMALVLLTLGCGVRWFGESALITGTVLGSVGIAVMNVIMPALARKRFPPQRIGMIMGIYGLMLGVGAVLGAGASFPLFQWMGADTPAAYHSLGLWAIPAGFALLLWLPQLTYPMESVAVNESATSIVNVYRSGTVWSITLFFGLQTLNLYVFLAWMPTLLMDRGTTQATAAWVFSASQISLMVASFIVPLLASRRRDQRPYIVMTVLVCLAGTLGLMYAPLGTALLWALLLGFGQGSGASLAFFLFVAKANTIDTATHISAMAQTVGFLIAALGPLLIGMIYQYTGDWQLPIVILSVILLLELLVSLPAGRDVKV